MINKVLFIGSKDLGLAVLKEMHSLSPQTLAGAISFDDRNDTRSVFDEFKSFSSENNIGLQSFKSGKDLGDLIEKYKPDLCLAVGLYHIIDNETLGKVKHGFIGIHNSLLPKYRGCAPLVWALINGEKEVGASFFSFTPGMDEGPVWAQASVLVSKTDYISDVLDKLKEKTIQVLREKYLPILRGEITAAEQDHNNATYGAVRRPEDGNINWHMSSEYIYNFIRAQSEPYPGAFTFLNGKMMKIWKAKPFEPDYFGTPGQVAGISREGVYVICGNNKAILLEDVEVDGRRGNPAEFIKSVSIRLSTRG